MCIRDRGSGESAHCAAAMTIRLLLRPPQRLPAVGDQLSQCADPTADDKGQRRVLADGELGDSCRTSASYSLGVTPSHPFAGNMLSLIHILKLHSVTLKE